MKSASESITREFDASSTATEVVAGLDLSGLRAVVTGGGTGIGLATTRALMAAGAEVTMAVRNTVAAAEAARSIGASGRGLVRIGAPGPGRSGVGAPLRSRLGRPPPSLRQQRRHRDGRPRAHAAGLRAAARHQSPRPFRADAAAARRAAIWRGGRDGAHVANVSSTALMRGGVDFDDLQFERRPYDLQLAYAQSKTANPLFSVELTRPWRSEDGIVANAVDPGGVVSGVQRNFSAEQKASLEAAEAAGAFHWKSVDQGAATSLVGAVHPAFAHTGDHYLDDCREAYTVSDDAHLADHAHGVKRWALDPEAAGRLWTVFAGLLAAAVAP